MKGRKSGMAASCHADFKICSEALFNFHFSGRKRPFMCLELSGFNSSVLFQLFSLSDFTEA